MADQLELDPDRLFPTDPTGRSLARELYGEVATLPIISPHGHVDAEMLLHNEAIPDASELLIRQDHYVTRLLHAAGVDLGRLGFDDADSGQTGAPARQVWREFCERWSVYAGTATGYWLECILSQLCGVTEHPSADNADRLFDQIGAALATPAFRPRALLDHFGVEVITTTDDPLSDLAAHATLAADPTLATRVLPTFRPDAYLDPAERGWEERVHLLAASNGTPASSFAGFTESLASRRRYFVDHGAVSADHGVLEPYAEDAGSAAARLFERALAGTLSESPSELRAFRGHMLWEMARMSADDGLVMTLHPGVVRNHHGETLRRFGADTGHDLPRRTNYVEALRPMLERLGTAPGFHLVLFTVDETAFSREIAPLAGFYPSVFIGAPWWFLDAPDAVLRFRSAVTETAGFSRGSGFVDDTRSLPSIPVRHDMSRRLDAAFLAGLITQGRLDLARARRIIVELVDAQPRRVFKL